MRASKIISRTKQRQITEDQKSEMWARDVRTCNENAHFVEFIQWVESERDRLLREADGKDAFQFGALKGIQSILDRARHNRIEAQETLNVATE